MPGSFRASAFGRRHRRMKRILDLYLAREMWPPFFASLIVAVFIVIATELLPITELIVGHGVKLSLVLWVVLYLLPDILTFSMPAASLMSAIVAFLRLSSDSEIIAMRASGISLRQMLPAVVALSALGLIVTLLIAVFAVPWGNRSFKETLFEMAQAKAATAIRPNVFSEPFPNVIFYVNSFSRSSGAMEQVFVVDRRDGETINTIVAEEGRISYLREKQTVMLRFSRGTILAVESAMDAARTIKFETYDLVLELHDMIEAWRSREKSPKELTVPELLEEIGKNEEGVRRNEMVVELMEKITVPMAVFFMALVGFPLGAQLQSRGRSVGIGIGVGVFMAYYICLAAVRSLSESALVPPVLAVWIPNVFLVVAFTYLFRRVSKEQPLDVSPDRKSVV